jgi:1-acyl-sn-glycerol-3-phosphate acyltransferase
MNRQPFRLKSPQWDAKLSPFWVRATRFYRRQLRITDQRLLEIEIRGLDRVRELLARNDGVLITPNHPGHADSYALYEATDQLGLPFYFMTAWQVFELGSPIARWFYQRYGCFSVEREGADLWAFKRAAQILAKEPNPLVIFPEGDVYHVNDRVTPLREGTAAIALTAMKQAERPIHVVPCGLKYQYIQDPTPELQRVMTELEERIYWRPRPDRPLADRIYRFAEAVLALKELEYTGKTATGSLPERVQRLMEHVLSALEKSYGVKAGGLTVPERVKSVRRACLEKLEQTAEDTIARSAIQAHLDDVFFVVQLFSYPGDYVAERPTIERVAETIDKFEEDVLGHRTARIRGARRAIVQFGEPIDVRAFAAGAAQPRKAAGPLTDTIERAMQKQLDEINHSIHVPTLEPASRGAAIPSEA